MAQKYEIKFATGDSPILYLESEMTLGKFGQNLNLDHPDISEKHCTVTNTNGVLSVRDHNSEKGTLINGKPIPADQPILLQQGDQLSLGSVGVQIKKVIVTDEDAVPNLPDDMPDVNSAEVDFGDFDGTFELDMSLEPQLDVDIDESEEPTKVLEMEVPKQEEPTTTKILDEASLNKEINSETVTNRRNEIPKREMPELPKDDSAVTEQLIPPIQKKKISSQLSEHEWGIPFLFRFAALIIDINLSVFLTQLLIEYDALFLIDPFIEEGTKLSLEYTGPWIKYLLPYLIVYLGFVLVGNLLFKKSLGKQLLFLSVEGKGLGSRVRALGRGILGLITWPFVIFDFPSLFSKPTVKEAIFSSRFYVQSKVITFVLVLVILPLSFGVAFLTSFLERFPLEDYKSFEYKTINFSGNASSEGVTNSRYYGFEKPKRSRVFLEYPYFKAMRKKNKKFFIPTMRVYYPAEKMLVRFERIQEKIDLKKMLSYAVRTNPLAFLRFGEIIKFVDNQPYNTLKFYEEFKNLTKSSLELSLENASEHVLQYGPFFKSFFDYRDSLLSSVDKRIQDVRFVKLGEKHFMKITPPPGKFAENNLVEEIFVPLERVDMSILRFQLESKDPIAEETALKFYRQYLGGIEWSHKFEAQALTKKLGAFEIIDYFSKKDAIKVNSIEEHGYIFRYFWKIGRLLAKSTNLDLKKDYLQKLKSFREMIIGLNQNERKRQDEMRESSLEEATYDRLIRKINELIDALNSGDLIYFSLMPKLPEVPEPAPAAGDQPPATSNPPPATSTPQ